MPRDLDYQERITNSLARCTPVLEALADPSALLHLLEHDLGVPIGIVSEGPTAEEKQIVRQLVQRYSSSAMH